MCLGQASLRVALDQVLQHLELSAPDGFYYGTHSARIGGFNELSLLQFSKVFLMHRLDWSTESMFRTYYDGLITRSPDSDWFFAHLQD